MVVVRSQQACMWPMRLCFLESWLYKEEVEELTATLWGHTHHFWQTRPINAMKIIIPFYSSFTTNTLQPMAPTISDQQFTDSSALIDKSKKCSEGFVRNGSQSPSQALHPTFGGEDVISVPIFVNPKPTDIISPLVGVLQRDEKPIYKQVLYSDYVKHFFGKAHDGKTIGFAEIRISLSDDDLC
ncbi:hypothetical protein V6N12_015877 [Hibiscus sabdariffa]|uniref:Uncharacterized protein n=1 Tax=Hibiscus sabdariffa TaxID=183260 RepID=A0ABR2DSG4_9ROSI